MLQALKDADPWEDEEIDEMLAAADASGDGELQVEDTAATPLQRPSFHHFFKLFQSFFMFFSSFLQ